jgi:hypothetical protein
MNPMFDFANPTLVNDRALLRLHDMEKAGDEERLAHQVQIAQRAANDGGHTHSGWRLALPKVAILNALIGI